MGSNARRPKDKPICLHKGAEIERLCECGGYKPDAHHRHVRRLLNRSHKLRAMGKPIFISPEEYAAARQLIVEAHDDYGMSFYAIGEVIGCHFTWPVKVYSGQTKTMKRERYHRILSVLPVKGYRPERSKAPSGARTPALGAQRRMRALYADGFTCKFMGEFLGWTLSGASKFAHEEKTYVFASTDREMRDAYAKLAGTNPLDYGIFGPSSKQMKTLARNNGWAPSHCWDDDTIDDPDAFAEWTGECGSTVGYSLHKRYGIPTCAPCRHAKTDYEGERRRELRKAQALALLDAGKTYRYVCGEMSMSTRTLQRYVRERRAANAVGDDE